MLSKGAKVGSRESKASESGRHLLTLSKQPNVECCGGSLATSSLSTSRTRSLKSRDSIGRAHSYIGTRLSTC